MMGLVRLPGCYRWRGNGESSDPCIDGCGLCRCIRILLLALMGQVNDIAEKAFG